MRQQEAGIHSATISNRIPLLRRNRPPFRAQRGADGGNGLGAEATHAFACPAMLAAVGDPAGAVGARGYRQVWCIDDRPYAPT